MHDIYDTAGITAAVVHQTIHLDADDIARPRDELEAMIRAGDFQATTTHIEFIEGRVA